MLNFFVHPLVRKNRLLLSLCLLWLLRIMFLRQGNVGGVAINRYVLLQIVIELWLLLLLAVRGMDFMQIFRVRPLRWFSWLYLLGVFSGFWSLLPLMSSYFAFQNLLALAVLLYFFRQVEDLFQAEKFLFCAASVILAMFFISCWNMPEPDFHSVSISTVSGALFLYSAAEYDPAECSVARRRLLRIGIVGGLLMLWLTSSAGALVGVACGVVAMTFLAKSRVMRLTAGMSVAGILVAYWLCGGDFLLRLLFPGKSWLSVQTGHGRMRVWTEILERASERPWFGWGYACLERRLEVVYTIDTHNAALGVLGNLGYVGCALGLVALLSSLVFMFRRRGFVGMRGVLIAMIGALVNSNSSNFIVGKASVASVAFQSLLVLGCVCGMLGAPERQKNTSES